VTYFAFADGAIGYDCVRCGARCCQGLGFALYGHELVPLLTRAPGLAPFLQLQPTRVAAFNLTDGCWCLADDGRCTLEVAHGRAAKPGVCRLFPLRLMRFGATLAVDLQLCACPLEAADGLAAGPGRTVLRHRDVEADLADPELAAFVIDARVAPGAPDDLAAREAALRDQAAAHAGDGVLAIIGDADPRLAALRDGWRRFFAFDADEAAALDARVARPLALALPSLRLAALTANGAAPYPRVVGGLPSRLAALATLAALSLRAGRAASLRGLGELWRGTPLVREALARWDAPPSPSLAATPPPTTAPVEVVRAWERLAAAPTLGEGLEATVLAPPLRPLLLRLVSDRL
jgi:hypothetical protein